VEQLMSEVRDQDRVLFIDIDGTLIRRRADVDGPPAVLGHELLALMVDEAARQGRCSRPTALQRVQAVMNGKVWWDWPDYLRALELDEPAFWALASSREAHYLEPCHRELAQVLLSLARSGYRCCITSNNPASGIRHKLALAGLAEVGREVFAEHIGTDRVQAMKGSPAFWRGALQATAARAAQVIVIGDSPHDDVAIPRQVGIVRHVVVHQPPQEPWSNWPGVRLAPDWSAVPALVQTLAHEPIAHHAQIPGSPLVIDR
jgi:FMN phosphatase YigB (HAD superfamily)